MKRVLIVTLVVLELALVALVKWESTYTSTHETAPVAGAGFARPRSTRPRANPSSRSHPATQLRASQ